MPPFLITLFHGVVLALLLVALFQLAVHLAVMPRLRAPLLHQPSGAVSPRISVLVPARNEALNIERCVRSLLTQDYPNFSVHVLDDHSTDSTAAIVRSLGLTEGNGGLLRGAELPERWVGKNWACHQLSQVADGEYLLFTDADTEHQPGMLRALLGMARQQEAVLVSAWPEQLTETFAERLVVSLLPFCGLLFYPHLLVYLLGKKPLWRQRVPISWRRGLGAANGQVLFFSRTGYRAIGGHLALREHLVEDVALGRAVAERMGEGLWWVNCDGARFVRCRMYRNTREVWEGFTKNARAAFEGFAIGFWAAGLLQLVLLLLPFAFLLGPERYRDWAVLQVCVILTMRILATAGLGGSWWSVILHPFAYGFALAIGMNSWRRSRGPGVLWKGRLYAVRHPLQTER